MDESPRRGCQEELITCLLRTQRRIYPLQTSNDSSVNGQTGRKLSPRQILSFPFFRIPDTTLPFPKSLPTSLPTYLPSHGPYYAGPTQHALPFLLVTSFVAQARLGPGPGYPGYKAPAWFGSGTELASGFYQADFWIASFPYSYMHYYAITPRLQDCNLFRRRVSRKNLKSEYRLLEEAFVGFSTTSSTTF